MSGSGGNGGRFGSGDTNGRHLPWGLDWTEIQKRTIVRGKEEGKNESEATKKGTRK